MKRQETIGLLDYWIIGLLHYCIKEVIYKKYIPELLLKPQQEDTSPRSSNFAYCALCVWGFCRCSREEGLYILRPRLIEV